MTHVSSYDAWQCPELPAFVFFPLPFVFNLHSSHLITMFRQITARPLISANRAFAQRSFSVAVPRLGEGDTGAPRSGPGGSTGYVGPSSPCITCNPLFQLFYACNCDSTSYLLCRRSMASSIADPNLVVTLSPSVRPPRKLFTSVRRRLRSKSHLRFRSGGSS